MAFGYIILLVIVIAVIWGVGAAIGAVLHNKNVASKTTPSATPALTSTPSPKPTPTPTNSTAVAVSDWYTSYGSSVVSAFTADASAIEADANNSDETTMNSDCQKMSQDIAKGQNAPAIPDSSLEKDWSAALADYQSSAQDCMNGINDDDTNLISQAATEMTSGNTAIANVTAGVKALTP